VCRDNRNVLELKCSVLLASHHAINKSKQMNVRTDICPAKPLTCVVRR